MKHVLQMSLLVVFGIVIASTTAAAQTVSGSIGNGTISPGRSAKGVVVLSIPSGLHVNSNKPKSKYAIPTTVTVTSGDARLSAVRYPSGKTKKFSFSNEPINVYEGRVAFVFNVAVPATFKGKTVRVRAVVKYQACNDEVCFPPKSKDVVVMAIVK